MQGTCATPVCAAQIFITLEFSCKSGAHRGCCTCKDDPSTNRVRFNDSEIMFACELHNFRHIIRGRAMASAIFFSAQRSALLLDLFTDFVGQIACSRGSQIDSDFYRLIGIYGTDPSCSTGGCRLKKLQQSDTKFS